MACSNVIRLGDEKTSIQLLVQDCKPDNTIEIVDLTDATDITIRFKREKGDEIEKPGVIYTGGTNGDGTDGIAHYVTETGFITSADIGTLQAIAIVTFADGGIFHSSPAKYKVKANF